MTHFERALITGASSGIGAELARQLAAGGTEVVLVARREERLRSLAEGIEAGGGRVRIEVLDVTDVEALRAMIARVDGEVGGLDLIVANAGVGLARPGTEMTWSDVEPVLTVNVVAAMATIVAGLERMRPRGRGTLCGVSSLASRGGMPGSGAYCASKAALATFLETLAIDLAGSGITLVDVQPGFVVSEMTDQNDAPMPFLWSTERAAARIVRDLERGRAICTFPWQLSVPLALSRSLPRWLWRAVAHVARPRG